MGGADARRRVRQGPGAIDEGRRGVRGRNHEGSGVLAARSECEAGGRRAGDGEPRSHFRFRADESRGGAEVHSEEEEEGRGREEGNGGEFRKLNTLLLRHYW